MSKAKDKQLTEMGRDIAALDLVPMSKYRSEIAALGLLPEAELRTFEGLGHLSIWTRTMEAAGDLAAQVSGDNGKVCSKCRGDFVPHGVRLGVAVE